jgi:hypothetical protein
LELPKQSLIISRANWRIDLAEKFTFIWMVLALQSLYFDSCSLVELGNFCILLGISQVDLEQYGVMKIDLVGEKDRGLAMGLNEFGLFRRWPSCFPVRVYCRKYGITPTLSIWGLDFDNWILLTLLLSKTRDYMQ